VKRAICLSLAMGFATAFAPARAVDLPTALQAARQADPMLSSAEFNRDAARENIAIAKARLLPQISAQTTQQMTNQTTIRDGSHVTFTGPSSSTSISLRQALFRKRDFAGLELAQLQALYGEVKLSAARAEHWNRVVGAWLDVLAAMAVRDVQSRSVTALTRTAEQERRRFARGDGTRDATAEAAAQLSQAQAEHAAALLDTEAKLRAFSQITRLPVQEFSTVRLPVLAYALPLPDAEDRLLERVLETNPDAMLARINEQMADRRLAQSSADHWPTVDAIASANDGRSDSTSVLGLRYRNAQAGVQISLPLYSGGSITATERQSAANLSAARSDRELLLQKVRIQFETDWRMQAGLRERAIAAEAMIKAADEQKLAYELGVKVGMKTWADVGAAELLSARRQSERVTLVQTLLKAQSRLLSLLPTDDGSVDHWVAEVGRQSKL
jgi:protease secretion system outer membrane protein